LAQRAKRELDLQLNEELEGTFPASDPPKVTRFSTKSRGIPSQQRKSATVPKDENWNDQSKQPRWDAPSNHLKIYRFAEGYAMVGSKFSAAAGGPGFLIEAILSTASDAIIATDADGRITFWNLGATRIFDFTSEEAVGSSLDLIIPEALRARHWAGYTRVMATGKRHCDQGDLLSVPGLTRDGRRISAEFTIVLLHDQGGELVGTAAILGDATRRFEELQRRLTECQHRVFPSESGSVRWLNFLV
jgi:PAS domain S-box-containing protein